MAPFGNAPHGTPPRPVLRIGCGVPPKMTTTGQPVVAEQTSEACMAPTHAHFTADTTDTALSRSVNWMASTEPSRSCFEAVVLHAAPTWFVLDSTWFEPEAAGALGDEGWLLSDGNRVPIMRVEPDGAHYTDDARSLEVGSRVAVSIDPVTRLRRMRTAALQNLVRSVLSRSGEWSPAQRTITRATLQQGWTGEVPCLDAVRAEVAGLIRERHQIWRVVDDADGRAYWQVDGVATIADERLSVTDTGAIGPFALRFADRGGRLCIFGETLPT